MAKEHGSFAETKFVLTELIPQDICNKNEEEIERTYVSRSFELQREMEKAIKKIYGKDFHLVSGLDIVAAKEGEIEAFREHMDWKEERRQEKAKEKEEKEKAKEEKPHPGKGKGLDKKEK